MKNVIVIEDNRVIRQILATWLYEEDYKVKTLENTLDLTGKLQAFQPDLIITDIMLPNTTATELIELFASIPFPIVVLSSMDKEDLLFFAKRIAAVAYFQKPNELSDLFGFLHDFLKTDNLTLAK